MTIDKTEQLQLIYEYVYLKKSETQHAYLKSNICYRI